MVNIFYFLLLLRDFREKELYKNLTEKVDRFSSRKKGKSKTRVLNFFGTGDAVVSPKGFRINNLPSEPVDFSSETDREYEQLLEDITNLEERLLSASLQSKVRQKEKKKSESPNHFFS